MLMRYTLGGAYMVTIFNRKELTTTFTMAEQSRIRSLLANNNINYKIKIINRRSPSMFDAGNRTHMGTFDENMSVSYEYIVFVHKNDYEQSQELIYLHR